MGPEILEESSEENIEDNMNIVGVQIEKDIKVSSEFYEQVPQEEKQPENSEIEKDNEIVSQEFEKEKLENQSKMLTLNELQELETEVFQNESNQKDTQVEFLKLELAERKKENQLFNEKMPASQLFFSAENESTLKSMSNVVETSARPEIVPKQSEKVQRVQVSYSNDGEEQIDDLMPDQQAVQTPDGQLQITPQSEEQQPMVVTQLESIIASPMATSSTQVLSQSVLQSSPKNTPDPNEGPLSAILDTPKGQLISKELFGVFKSTKKTFL